MSFSENFRNARLNAGLTQKQVADTLGVHRIVIAYYEKNFCTPDADRLAKICELFGISSDELLKA